MLFLPFLAIGLAAITIVGIFGNLMSPYHYYPPGTYIIVRTWD